jgi:energy-coupling factor transporter ATP-binding protein EcfA2
VSPNASNNSKEEAFWKILIEQESVALMGWDSSNKYGNIFANEVSDGDFILIAQGNNVNKTLYFGGVVNGTNKSRLFPKAPRSIFYRPLIRVIKKNELDSLGLNFVGSAYKEADRIPAIYKLKPNSNKIDLELVQKLQYALQQQAMITSKNISPILEYKKQIILQGPPGTGKTRLAKEIAMAFCQSQKLTNDFIRKSFQLGLELDSSSKSKKYIVELVDDIGVTLKLESGTSYRIPYSGIIDSYIKRLWKGGLKNNLDSYCAALAKYIFEVGGNQKTGEFKLIQFHPAYSYEDFVRGIVVETEDGVPTYRSINKIFAELADKALQNYQDSLKSPEEVSREKQLDKFLDEFKDEVEVRIETSGGKYILDGTTTYLFDVDETSFRYTGDNWASSLGHRLYLKDILLLFLDKAKTRKDIKANAKISGSARQHSSYYLRVLQQFEKFLEDKTINQADQEKAELKNYVLIIDEINRANLPSVLGELIYGLEYRGEAVESMYALNGDRKMIIPPNLYVIGTMNTADRSVSHIDYAIRRRFAFVDVLPAIDPIKNELAKVMFEKVSKLFVSNYAEVIASQDTPKRAVTLMSDFKPEEVWIGHSYFLNSEGRENDNDEIKIKMKYEVLPLLKEYVKDGILRSNEDKLDDPVQMVLKELNGL